MNFDRFGFKAKSQRHRNWLYATLDLYSNCYGVAFSPAWIKPETICQCTGLRDSDGKLIYENDILEVEMLEGNQTGIVYYQEQILSFRVRLPLRTATIPTIMSLAGKTGKKVRVIGNKFDKEVGKK